MAEPFQILGLRDQVHDSNGNPLSGGSIDVFAAGTTTRVTTYSDADLTQENANPVPLSGSARASVWVNRPVDIRINDSTSTLVTEELQLNPDNVVSGFDSGLVPNGSFETDSNADDVPDGWTNDVNATGSNNGLETGVGNTGAGTQSWRTQSTGNGGGELVTTNPFPVNDFDDLNVQFVLRSTVATVRNIVRVEWYDVTDTLISSTDVYDSTANPAAFTQQAFTASPPSGARLARLRIIGGTTGGLGSGITYWDNVRAFYAEITTGQFDNILISGNTISSTNTDGNINLDPNGTGTVAVVGPLSATGRISTDENVAVDLTDALAPLRVGPVASGHLEVGNNGLQWKSDATTAAALALQPLGGNVTTGANLSVGADLTAVNVTASGALATDSTDTVDLTDTTAALRVGQGTTNHLEADGTQLQSKSDATTAAALNLNVLGGDVSVGEPSANTQTVTLQNQNTIVQASQSAGLVLRNRTDGDPALGSVQNIYMQTQRADGTPLFEIGHPNAAGGVIRNLNHGGGILIEAEDAGGTLRTIFEGDPDTDASMYFAGSEKIRTRNEASLDNITGGAIRGRDGLFHQLPLGATAPIGVSTSTSISPDHVYRTLSISSPITITFDQDSDIPVGAWGSLLIPLLSVTIAPGTGVTLIRDDNSGSVGSTAVGPYVSVRWFKTSLTEYWYTISPSTPGLVTISANTNLAPVHVGRTLYIGLAANITAEQDQGIPIGATGTILVPAVASSFVAGTGVTVIRADGTGSDASVLIQQNSVAKWHKRTLTEYWIEGSGTLS